MSNNGFDLSALEALIKKEMGELNNRGSREENDRYPIRYLGSNGKITMKLFFNPKSNTTQRLLTRHDTGKKKIACLGMYGEKCPVCEAVSQVEETKGRELGVFRKYGFKRRGICYAQVIDHEATYFTEDNDPQKGDIFIPMYSRTVYDAITKILSESMAAGSLKNIILSNEGLPVVVERTINKGNNIPQYSAHVYPYGSKKSFEDSVDENGNVVTGDQKFLEILNELPDLQDVLHPQYPTEEMLVESKALAESIIAEYLLSDIINPAANAVENNKGLPGVDTTGHNTVAGTPSQPDQKPVTQQQQQQPAQTPPTEVSNSVPNNSNLPDCHGNHEPGTQKCMMCPFETESCFIATAENKSN